ncbi:hypothetical protein L1987_42320 [Smallanthus sonchifolius]|uniref:Uncharacterized protein n=1 Tax=Smallanthus sonchifolius TaxID=185202 RepID=A0ACB9GIJ1_9ASTR|nr:hypothetical protein L1987_42320 [Smallanthus sonchifolius]
MLLGKRQRPPMKRTTSMTELTLDLNHVDTPRSTDQPFSSRNIHRRNSAETAHFLRACHLCKRRLMAGRDIFMYRGDSAFCSLECRQQQMNQDDKFSMSSNKTPSETVAAM